MSNDEKLKLEDFQRAARAVESVSDLILCARQQARAEVIEEVKSKMIAHVENLRSAADSEENTEFLLQDRSYGLMAKDLREEAHSLEVVIEFLAKLSEGSSGKE